MPIRATKSGWLIATKLVKETKKYYHLIDLPEHEHEVYKLAKDNNFSKIFDSVDEAEKWMEEDK